MKEQYGNGAAFPRFPGLDEKRRWAAHRRRAAICNDYPACALSPLLSKTGAQRGRQMQDEIEELREKAGRCRALADVQPNVVAVSELLALAFEYDSRAEKLETQFRKVGGF
jgi:hypothetical protein